MFVYKNVLFLPVPLHEKNPLQFYRFQGVNERTIFGPTEYRGQDVSNGNNAAGNDYGTLGIKIDILYPQGLKRLHDLSENVFH